MVEVFASFTLELNPAAPECDRVMALIREHSVDALRIRALRMADKLREITAEDRKRYHDRSTEIGKLLVKCFADNRYVLQDLRWDTSKFLTPEEEASAQAPPG